MPTQVCNTTSSLLTVLRIVLTSMTALRPGLGIPGSASWLRQRMMGVMGSRISEIGPWGFQIRPIQRTTVFNRCHAVTLYFLVWFFQVLNPRRQSRRRVLVALYRIPQESVVRLHGGSIIRWVASFKSGRNDS